MRRKPYLSLLLAIAILGGVFALFPTVWMLLVIALVALVTLQVIVVRRNLYSLPAGHTQVALGPPAELTPARGPAPASGPEAPAAASTSPAMDAAPAGDPASAGAGPAAPTSPPSPAAAPRANLDRSLFSRFQRHLNQAEAEAAGTATPRTVPPPPPMDASEVQDRVQLSGAARRAAPPRPAATPAAPRPAASPAAPSGPGARAAAPAPEPEGPDIFADLRPAPPLSPPAPAITPPPDSGPPARSRRKRAAATPPTETPPARTPGDEVSAALASGGQDAPGLADEAATLLRLAEESAQRADWEGLRAGLGNYVAHLADAPRLIHWRGRRLQVRLAVHDKDGNRALQAFEDLLDSGFRPAVDEVPGLLDELLDGAEREAAAGLRVSMLVRILAGLRQARDQRAMDRCYGWIEEAQEQVGDERRLLQYLKNHLEIRKVLGDVPGQLDLIDQLGNRCYRLGLTEDAKLYYEMGLRLRAESGDTLTLRPGGTVREG